MWDRLPVTLVTVLKPFLRSMSGFVKVSCPFTGCTHTHTHTRAQLKGSAHLYKTFLQLWDLQSVWMGWKRVNGGRAQGGDPHVYSGLLG